MSIINLEPPATAPESLHGEDFQEVKCFLKGAVYAWCSNSQKETDKFSVHTLVGGKGGVWTSITPLKTVWERYCVANNVAADAQYARKCQRDKATRYIADVLEYILHKDPDKFKWDGNDWDRHYLWLSRDKAPSPILESDAS